MKPTSKPTLLPFEKAVTVIGGTKITSSIAPAIRYHLGKIEARNFYTNTIKQVHGSNKGGLGWSVERFDSVDWRAIADAISNRPEMFQLLLSKQAIGVCTTQKNTARIQDILDDRFPNYGKRPEDNHYLNRCPDPGRVKLFSNGVRKLSNWMRKGNQTDTELAFSIREYLLHRGQVKMANLAIIRPMSTAMKEVAESQDEIGWVEFLHGKVSTKLRLLQKAHCIAAGTRTSGDNCRYIAFTMVLSKGK